MTNKTKKQNTQPFASIHVPTDKKEEFKQHRQKFLEGLNPEWNPLSNLRPAISISAAFRAMLSASEFTGDSVVISMDAFYAEAGVKSLAERVAEAVESAN